MPAAKHNDGIAVDPISNEIRANDRKLPMAVANGTATFGVLLERLTRRDQSRSHSLRGKRIELGDVGDDVFEVVCGLVRPDYSPHLGRGSSPGVPHDANHRIMASLLMTRPAR